MITGFLYGQNPGESEKTKWVRDVVHDNQGLGARPDHFSDQTISQILISYQIIVRSKYLW